MPFKLLVSTVSNVRTPFVQLEALIKGINENEACLLFIRHLEICTMKGTWGPGIYVTINRLDSSR